MMRIAYLTSEYPAPSHTFIRREIAALRRRGLVILPISVRPTLAQCEERIPAILGSRWHCTLSAAKMLLCAPVRSLSTWALAQVHRAPGVRGWMWAQFHVVEALALSRMLAIKRVDHLHSHFANSGATVGMLAAHCLRLPWSLTLHGISETDAPAGLMLSDKLARAQFVACASWFMRAQAMRVSTPELWSKFHVVRCGVDLSNIPETGDKRRRRAQGPVHFVTVGRLSPEKGHSGLLEAFEHLAAQGINAKLTIVGDGPLRTIVERQIESSSVASRVVMTGALPENEALAEIAKADIFVLSSLMEGLPVVLMEAMALGKPVIAPAVAGIPELVSHNETGLLFRPGDWQQLCRRMCDLANVPATWSELGQRARERIESEFEIDAAVWPLVALYSVSEVERVSRQQLHGRVEATEVGRLGEISCD